MNDRLTKRLLIDRYKANEYAVYLIGWILLFCIPLITQFYSGGSIRYDRLVRGWVHLLPFLAVFFINDSILMPFLFLKWKKTIYLSIVACILLTVWFGINPPPRPTLAGVTLPAPPVEMFRVTNVVMAACAILANLAIKMYFISHRKDMEILEVKNEQMKSELESLKYQINPHFLMNTLNNIQSLVEIDPVKAYETIQELSKMMRYVLYDNKSHKVPLRREVEFIENFIALMRLRYPEQVVITMNFQEEAGNVEVPPLLFITFVENAFKHGISYKENSLIAIDFTLDDDKLIFKCMNTNPKKNAQPDRNGGIGLENVRRRLELLYHGRYNLNIDNRVENYLVELEITIK